jgi:heterodisulfide reductase subunit A-like polyferredoxin
MFRAEYIAGLDETSCSGCKACIRKCQFDAIQYNGKKNPVTIDPVKCYGCGVCRTSCPEEAIYLESREKHPTGSQLWI